MRKLLLLCLGLMVIVSAISPALALKRPGLFDGPSVDAWYAFQWNPFSDILYVNTDMQPWLYGYDSQYTPNTAVLGYIQHGWAYIAVDLPKGGIEMGFIVVNVATRSGWCYRIMDDLTLIGPDDVVLTPVVGESVEGRRTADEYMSSEVAPTGWYDFVINPYVDVVSLNTDLSPWLWGVCNVAGNPCYPAPVLGYTQFAKFYFACDYIDGEGCFPTLSLFAGKISSRDGYFMAIGDDLSLMGPEYFWLTLP
ncbi:MAG: hypothetical protein JSV58_07105 [Candidatus Bathyarchaeota archaeon]|nr:MAG: hypothetical protein JSV58_07105 [Candidatus Bathyarchaeota archaeon]